MFGALRIYVTAFAMTVVMQKRLNRSKYRLGNGQTRVGPKNRVLDGVHIVAT